MAGLSALYTETPTLDDVVEAVVARSGFSAEALRGPSRCHPLVHYRQLAMTVARLATDCSLPVIGGHFDRDHTTVHHAVGRIMGDPRARSLAEQLAAECCASMSGEGAHG